MVWSKIEGSGSVPSVRAFHTSILNETKTSLLIYGGCNRDDVPYGDLYRFDIGTNDDLLNSVGSGLTLNVALHVCRPKGPQEWVKERGEERMAPRFSHSATPFFPLGSPPHTEPWNYSSELHCN